MPVNRKKRTNLIICTILITCAVVIYSIKNIFYGDHHSSFKFIFNALGILPVNLLLMTFIFNKLLTVHNRDEKRKKRDMLMGVFFSECGCKILRMMAKLDTNKEQLYNCSSKPDLWEGKHYENIRKTFQNYRSSFRASASDLSTIHTFLNDYHRYILTLINHPALVDHGGFADLIWSLFHLEDELNRRPDFSSLPLTDMEHLQGDLSRVYENILIQWMDHIVYLKNNYPYLFSLAMRTSPFNPEESHAIVS